MMKHAILGLISMSAIVGLSGVASAVGTVSPYTVPAGATLPFFVMGSSASLTQIIPGASIANQVPVGNGLLEVDVQCNSLAACTGLVVGH